MAGLVPMISPIPGLLSASKDSILAFIRSSWSTISRCATAFSTFARNSLSSYGLVRKSKAPSFIASTAVSMLP